MYERERTREKDVQRLLEMIRQAQVVAGSQSCFSIVHLKDINWRLRNNRLRGYKSEV
jgi:hypothetical protein